MSTTLFLTCRLSTAVADALTQRLGADPKCRVWVAACPYNTGPTTQFDALRAKFPDQLFTITTPQTAATVLPFIPWLCKQGVKLDFNPDDYRIKCAKVLLEVLDSEEGKKIDPLNADIIKAHTNTALSLLEEEAKGGHGEAFYPALTAALGWKMEELSDRLNYNHPECVCYKLPHVRRKGEDFDIGRAYGRALMLAGPNGALLDIFSALVFLGQLQLPLLERDIKLTMEEVESAVSDFIANADAGWWTLPGEKELWMDGELDDWAAVKLCKKFIRPGNLKVLFYAATMKFNEQRGANGERMSEGKDPSLYNLVMLNAAKLGMHAVHPDAEATNFQKAYAATRAQLGLQ